MRKTFSSLALPDIPSGFVNYMSYVLGPEESTQLVAALEHAPSVSIRVNRKKVSDLISFIDRFKEFGPTPVEWCDTGYHLLTRPKFVNDPLLHAGSYYVQEAASMYYESIVKDLLPKIEGGQPIKVLDMCAAPGGKSTAMLNALEGDYVLVANEYERSRSKILKENLDKWGDPNVIITNSSSDSFGRLKGYFDIVAVDAPCSGEGMMRREPVARSQWSPQLVKQCAALQKEILGNAIEALRPGGYLIFSTCTFNHEENEHNVEWLHEKGLTIVEDARRFMPHREKCEGLYVVCMQKETGEEPPVRLPKAKQSNSRLPDDVVFVRKENLDFEKIGERIYGVPETLVPTLRFLMAGKINILGAGTEIASMKGDLAIPSSRQVLSLTFDARKLPIVELSREDATGYLQGNPLSLAEGIPKGFIAVTYEGKPLGLMKNIGRRANNLYPAEWRIRTNRT